MEDEKEVIVPDASQEEGVELNPQAPVDIDYEAELKDALAREAIVISERDNYKKGLLMDKGKIPNDGTLESIKELAREDKQNIASDDIREIIRKTVLETASALVQKPTLDAMLLSLSTNPQERDLIKYHYEHSIVKGGLDESSVRSDLEKAYAIANSKKLRKTVSEMKVALDNRSQISNMPSGGSQDTTKEVKNSPWTQDQLAEMKKRGVNPDKVWQNYQKNLNKNK